MSHPFIEIVKRRERSLQKDLDGLVEEAAEIEKNLIIKQNEMTKYKNQLSLIAKHSSEGFIELERVLAVKDACPFCFIFHDNASELKCLPSSGSTDLFECRSCHKKYELEP